LKEVGFAYYCVKFFHCSLFSEVVGNVRCKGVASSPGGFQEIGREARGEIGCSRAIETAINKMFSRSLAGKLTV
jgi:hypothetical protein